VEQTIFPLGRVVYVETNGYDHVGSRLYCPLTAIDRGEIKAQLSGLLLEGLVHMDKADRFLSALKLYSSSKLDFVDTLLWASHIVEQEEVFTFDAKLLRSIRQEGS
jgi:predicted nucleic-acid-binding protein